MAASDFGVVLRSSICGDSLVSSIAGIGVTVSGERVRDRLRSESLWYFIASDNATIVYRSFSDGAIGVASVDSDNHTSSENRFFSFEILEEVLGVLRNESGSAAGIEDGRKSTSQRILERILSSILVDLPERVVLITLLSAISRTKFRDCYLSVSANEVGTCSIRIGQVGKIVLDDGSLPLELTDEGDTVGGESAAGEGGVSDGWNVLDLSRGELLVGRVPSCSFVINAVSSCPWVELVVFSMLVVHDGVVPWVLVVVTVGVAVVVAVVGSESVAGSVADSVVAACEFDGRGGACEKS